MLSMIDLPDLGRALITILVVVDPIGSLPVFYYATSSVPRRLHRAFAIRAVLIATVVLMLFLVGGQYLLEALDERMARWRARPWRTRANGCARCQ